MTGYIFVAELWKVAVQNYRGWVNSQRWKGKSNDAYQKPLQPSPMSYESRHSWIFVCVLCVSFPVWSLLSRYCHTPFVPLDVSSWSAVLCFQTNFSAKALCMSVNLSVIFVIGHTQRNAQTCIHTDLTCRILASFGSNLATKAWNICGPTNRQTYQPTERAVDRRCWNYIKKKIFLSRHQHPPPQFPKLSSTR